MGGGEGEGKGRCEGEGGKEGRWEVEEGRKGERRKDSSIDCRKKQKQEQYKKDGK